DHTAARIDGEIERCVERSVGGADTTPLTHVFELRVEHLYAAVPDIRNVEVAVGVESERTRLVEKARLGTALTDRLDESRLWGAGLAVLRQLEHLDPMIERVADEQHVAAGVEGHTARRVELPALDTEATD